MAKSMIYRYPEIKNDDSLQCKQYTKAIEEALKGLERYENGEQRKEAIDLLYFKNTHTYEGVAQRFNYNWRTIQDWSREFINEVGRNVGF